jgi:hypothetical protein
MLADVIFLLVIGMLVIAAAQLYSGARGSGIGSHPYHHVWGGAPGASRPSRMSGSEDRDVTSWSRGTR